MTRYIHAYGGGGEPALEGEGDVGGGDEAGEGEVEVLGEALWVEGFSFGLCWYGGELGEGGTHLGGGPTCLVISI